MRIVLKHTTAKGNYNYMATEQYCTPTSLQNEHSYENDMEKCKHSTIPTDENLSSGFDCSICLDSVQDPVVTLCGHLYCWPCIYQWIRQQSDSPDVVSETRTPQCPVCKAEVSEGTLIPLYGPGRATNPTGLGPDIPSRPNGVLASVTASTTMTSQLPGQHGGYYGYTSASEISLGGGVAVHPVISMFGEMICSRLSGNPQTTFYGNPSSYSVATARSARGRRRVIQADRSLSRLNFFLCCCLVMCLLLF
ncbi:hypothetical protein V2J09_006460 [Rumex salicifolius]